MSIENIKFDLHTSEPIPSLDQFLELYESANEKQRIQFEADARLAASIERAHETADIVGDVNIERNKEKLRRFIRRAAYKNGKDGATRKFQDFKTDYYQLIGIVLTGHPVFGKHISESKAFNAYFNGRAKRNNEEAEQSKAQLKEEIAKRHLPFPTIESERDESHVALHNINYALDVILDVGIEVAREAFPKKWKNMDYMPGDVATWIPKDMDGRKDVTWNVSIRETLMLQNPRFEDYLIPDLNKLSETLSHHQGVSDKLAPIIEKLKYSLSFNKEQMKVLDSNAITQNPSPKERSEEENSSKKREVIASMETAFSNSLHKRLKHPQEAIIILDDILQTPGLSDDEYALVLRERSKLKSHGVMLAKEHYRINSTTALESFNLILKAANLDEINFHGVHDNNGFNNFSLDERCFAEIADRLQKLEKIDTNLLDLATSRITLLTQMLNVSFTEKYIDSHSEKRMLVAETHNATVLMCVLAAAKYIGVDDAIGLSPLFEDQIGIENVYPILLKVLNNDAFLEYLKRDRESRHLLTKWLNTQLGFSDSARFIGALPAQLYNERAGSAPINLIKKMKKRLKEKGLDDIAHNLFVTGGVSWGRSFFLKSISDAASWMITPFELAFAKKNKIKMKAEISFQGQDGYVYFSSPESALAVITQLIGHVTANHSEALKRPFYNDMQKKMRSFASLIKDKVEKFTSSEKNSHLIGLFKGILHKTGSRSVSREKKTGGERKLPRAIQNNAVWQQVGYLTTVCYGLSAAIDADKMGFIENIQKTPELQKRLEYIFRVMDMGMLDAFKKYIDLYNPDYWADQASKAKTPEEKDAAEAVRDRVKTLNFYDHFEDAYTEIRRDFEKVQEVREGLDLKNDPQKDDKHVMRIFKKTITGRAAHAIKLTNLKEIFMQAVRVPHFSDKHEIERGDIINDILNFEWASVSKSLSDIFPGKNGNNVDSDFEYPFPSDLTVHDYADAANDNTQGIIEEKLASIYQGVLIDMDRHCAVG